MTKLVTLARVTHSIPLSTSCIYKGARAGRLPFLSRLGPEGRRTREWWVDVDMLAAFAQARGWPLDLSRVRGVQHEQARHAGHCGPVVPGRRLLPTEATIE
jgi:hypothetical protein